MQRKPIPDYMKAIKNRAKKSAEQLAAEEQEKLAQPQVPPASPSAAGEQKPPELKSPDTNANTKKNRKVTFAEEAEAVIPRTKAPESATMKEDPKKMSAAEETVAAKIKPPVFSNPPKPAVSTIPSAVTPARKPAVVALQKPPALKLPDGYKPPAPTAAVEPTQPPPSTAVEPTQPQPSTATPVTPTVMKAVEPKSAPETVANTSYAIPNRQEMDDVNEKYRELEKSLYDKIVDLHQQMVSLCAPNQKLLTPLPGNENQFAIINKKYNGLCVDLANIRQIETAMGEAKTTEAWLGQFHALSTQVDAISRQLRRQSTLDAFEARSAVVEPRKIVISPSNDLPLKDERNLLNNVNKNAARIDGDINLLYKKLVEYHTPDGKNTPRTYSKDAIELGKMCKVWLAAMEKIHDDIESNDPARALGISNSLNSLLQDMKVTLSNEKKKMGLLSSFTSEYPDIIKQAIANVETMQKELSPRRAEAERMKQHCQQGSMDQYTEKRTQANAKKNDPVPVVEDAERKFNRK